MEAATQNLISYSASAFVVIPRTPEDKQFCIVRDKPEEGDVFPKLKKFPGGGVKGEETPVEAASKEVTEETRLRIVNSSLKPLLEIHKRNFIPATGTFEEPHHDFFFVSSQPAEDRRPHPIKTDIEYADWETVEKIMEEMEKREIYPNHATAFRWFFSRKEFERFAELNEQREAEQVIAQLLERRGIRRWHVREGVLVLCFDTQCEDIQCSMYGQDVTRKREASSRYAPQKIQAKETIVEERKPVIHTLPELNGLVKLVLLQSASTPIAEDYVAFVKVNGEKMKFPTREVKGLLPEKTLSIFDLMSLDSSVFNLAGVEESMHGQFIAVWMTAKRSNGLLPPLSWVCLNAPPNPDLRLEQEDYGVITRAVRIFNRNASQDQKIWLHNVWEQKARRRH